MDFTPTADQAALAQRAAGVAQALAAGVAERERCQAIPHEVIRDLGERGLLGIDVPTPLGGLGAGAVAYALALREIAQVDAAVAVTMAVTNMVAETICRFGTVQQQETFVPPLVRGDYFAGAFALSEAVAGSDAGSLTTRAEKHPGGFRLTGQKMWITSGDKAGVMVVWARLSDAAPRALTCFLVEQGSLGVHFGRPEDKMGLRASHTVAVTFDNVFVPNERVLGELGGGFKIAMTALDGGRIGIAAQAVGLATKALSVARKHAQAQASPGQALMFALADMATTLDAAWLLTLQAALAKQRRSPCTRQAAMAKVLASETANQIIRQAIEGVGEAACLEDAGLARLFRDCRVTQIYEGTSEIQRLVISREILKDAG